MPEEEETVEEMTITAISVWLALIPASGDGSRRKYSKKNRPVP